MTERNQVFQRQLHPEPLIEDHIGRVFFLPVTGNRNHRHRHVVLQVEVDGNYALGSALDRDLAVVAALVLRLSWVIGEILAAALLTVIRPALPGPSSP